MDHTPTLHLFCGKIGSGKSTLAAQVAAAPRTILICEDRLLANLYPREIMTLEDYVRCSDRLRQSIAPHIVELLRKGMSVALDFQANTNSVRAWMRRLIEAADCNHQLHFLQTPDVVCRERLAARNASGAHEYQVSDADFDLFSSYFVGPDPEEGFNVVVHGN
jgi:predicted kinase